MLDIKEMKNEGIQYYRINNICDVKEDDYILLTVNGKFYKKNVFRYINILDYLEDIYF